MSDEATPDPIPVMTRDERDRVTALDMAINARLMSEATEDTLKRAEAFRAFLAGAAPREGDEPEANPNG